MSASCAKMSIPATRARYMQLTPYALAVLGELHGFTQRSLVLLLQRKALLALSPRLHLGEGVARKHPRTSVCAPSCTRLIRHFRKHAPCQMRPCAHR